MSGAAATILIAEDEALLRIVTAETLEDAGFEVIEACDGNAGLAVLKSGRKVDLVITDIQMPGLNGYQFAEETLKLNPGMKVVLMTGYAHDAVPETISRAGVRILNKPFDFDQLTTVISTLLKPAGA